VGADAERHQIPYAVLSPSEPEAIIQAATFHTEYRYVPVFDLSASSLYEALVDTSAFAFIYDPAASAALAGLQAGVAATPILQGKGEWKDYFQLALVGIAPAITDPGAQALINALSITIDIMPLRVERREVWVLDN